MLKLSFCYRVAMALIGAGLLGSVAASQPAVVQPASRPKVALVFEGGGALGFAHIGVIEWIEAHRSSPAANERNCPIGNS
jgi:NTE family protein